MRSTLFFRGITVFGVLLGAASCNLAQEQEKQKAEAAALEAEARKLEAEKRKLEATAKEQQQKIDALLYQLASAKDEATRLALQKQIEEERSKLNAKSKPGGEGDTAPPRAPAKPCNCPPGDPLCSCL